jgi:F-type H+-transporting ATPase subunit delta
MYNIAFIYAKGLLKVTNKDKMVSMLSSVNNINHVLSADDCKVFKFLINPTFTVEDKYAMLDILSSSINDEIPQNLKNFVYYLVIAKRENLILNIFNLYTILLNKQLRYTHIYITTDTYVVNKQKKYIQAIFRTCKLNKIYFHFSKNRKLIGGLRIKINNIFFDNSVISKLLYMKKCLT